MADPPASCTTDADCVTIDVPIGECGECAMTMVLGVSASQKDSYLAKNRCNAGACNKPSPSCVVHWHYAEDRAEPAQGTVVARCVHGTCVSQAR